MTETVRHDLMRSTNMLSVFNCIRKHGPISKRRIQEETGLSWGAVSTFSADLLERGIISETGRVDTGSRRSATAFDINLENNLIIGIDTNVIGMTGVIIDLKSRVKTKIHQELVSNHISELLEQMKGIIRLLMAEVSDQSVIKGIGVAFPGHVDTERGVSVLARQFCSLEPLDICGILKGEFGLPVVIEHDPNCCALSEQLFGAGQGLTNLLYVRLSRGIGMGIILGGEIYHGFAGATGEIGHITMDPDGGPCYCGNNGCLEIYASSEAVLSRCEQAARMGDAPRLAELLARGEPLTLETAEKAAAAGDGAVYDFFYRAADYAGLAVSAAINLLAGGHPRRGDARREGALLPPPAGGHRQTGVEPPQHRHPRLPPRAVVRRHRGGLPLHPAGVLLGRRAGRLLRRRRGCTVRTATFIRCTRSIPPRRWRRSAKPRARRGWRKSASPSISA